MHSPPPPPIGSSSSSSSTLPRDNLKRILQAISILVGQDPLTQSSSSSRKIGQPKPTLSSILSKRIERVLELQLPLVKVEATVTLNNVYPREEDSEEEEEFELQIKTGRIGLELFKLLVLVIQEQESTTTTTNNSGSSSGLVPPLFSINEIKNLKILTSIISRWSIGLNFSKLLSHQVKGEDYSNILPSQFRLPPLKKKEKEKQKFIELSDDDETDVKSNKVEFKKIVKDLIEILKQTSQIQQQGIRELRGILSPQILLPLLGSIIELITLTDHHEEQEEFNQYLKFLFNSNSIPNLLSNLLQLLSNSKPGTKTRSNLIKHLSFNLLRPGGIRSLLIVVVGLGGSEEEEEAGGVGGREKRFEMVWNLLLSSSSRVRSSSSSSSSSSSTTSSSTTTKDKDRDDDDDDYIENVLKQLFEILSHSTNSTILATTNTTTTPSNSSKLPPPPPNSIISATSYLIIHFFLLFQEQEQEQNSSSSSFRLRDLIQSQFHSSLLPLSYPTTTTTRNRTRSTTTKDLLESILKISIILNQTPPYLLKKILNFLLKPLLPSLFSFLTFYHKTFEEEEVLEIVKEDRRKKNNNREENLILKKEIENLLYLYGKTLIIVSSSSSSSSSSSESEEAERKKREKEDEKVIVEMVKDLTRVIEIIEEENNNKRRGDQINLFGDPQRQRQQRRRRTRETRFPQQQEEEEEEEEEEEMVEFEWKINESNDGIELRVKNDEEEGIRFPSSLNNSVNNNESLLDNPPPQVDLGIEPKVIISYLKKLNCQKLNSTIFLRWLDELRVLKSYQREQQTHHQGDDEEVEMAKKTVIRLQLILKMVEELGSEILSIDTSASGTGTGSEPLKIISFVGSILDVGSTSSSNSSSKNKKGKKEEGKGLKMEDLRIVVDQDEQEDEPDEEEMIEPSGLGGGNQEMIMTALTLLLAVLEANQSLTISNTPLLLSIDSKLETISQDSSSGSVSVISSLISEIRTVFKLRETLLKFSSNTTTNDKKVVQDDDDDDDDGMESSRKQYQTSLKLLQDPLLPVRAQGLHLLKTLIKPNSNNSNSNSNKSRELLKTDPALLPAILSIFLNSVSEEEDSFLYLNAIQGLSTLVDVFSKQVINGLIQAYTGGGGGSAGGGGGEVREVGQGEKGKKELDKRLRIGEALIQVIQRSGTALATLQDNLIPPLLSTLRQTNLPITLRSSCITILATMVETAPLAMFDRLGQLGESMRTLLEVETVSFTTTTTKTTQEKEKEKGKGKAKVLIQEIDPSSSSFDDEEEDEDEKTLFSNISLPTPPPSTAASNFNNKRREEEVPDPLTKISKHPSLRRAALLFLSLLVRTNIKSKYELIENFQKQEMEFLGKSLIRDGKLRLPNNNNNNENFNLSFDTRGGGGGREVEMGIGRKESERLKITLRYLSETDRDELVRFQAGQVLEEMEEAGL
ncbi:hypothetical protein JCM3765_001328 [Sporobolomyces pararoseus]